MRIVRNCSFRDSASGVRSLARWASSGTALLALTLWISVSPALAEKYYIRQNGQVFEISETAAQSLVPDEWRVYFFKRGYSPSSNSNSPGHWGSNSNKDLGRLLEEVRQSIEFDKDRRKEWFCNYECQSNPIVYDNYFGPIAVFYKNDPNRLPEMPAEIPREIARAKDLASQLLGWVSNFAAASRITSLEDVRNLAAKSAEGKVRNLDPAAIQGMLENLKNAIEGLGKLQAFMNDVGAQADKINQQLASVADDLKAASQAALKIKQSGSTDSESGGRADAKNTESLPLPPGSYRNVCHDCVVVRNQFDRNKLEMGCQCPDGWAVVGGGLNSCRGKDIRYDSEVAGAARLQCP
jgi:hypothetical protein